MEEINTKQITEKDNPNSTTIQSKTIKNIGTILSVNDNGYIVNQSSIEKITQPWSNIVSDIVEAYKKHIPNNIHSIYIKGSVSRGTPIKGISDIDCLALLHDVNIDTSWKDSLKKDLESKYPFCTDFDLVDKDVKKITDGKNKIAPVLLKTMATCVYGKDVIRDLPDIKPGKESLICTYGFKNFINKKIELLNNKDESIDIKSQCKYIMKRILRTAFELVMEKEESFTRDLYPCYELFSKNYPEKEKEMKEVLFLAINNTDDKEKILEILNGIGIWITEKVENIYNIRIKK